jgi:S-adenosylmethionine decarboxylase
MNESAGVHVIIDGYVRDPSVFTKNKIEELFHGLTDALSMKMLGAPIIYEVPVDSSILERCKKTGNFEDEGGITGFAVISTSHMSIHCWPLQKFFSLDTFSCKDFDSDKAISIIRRSLDVHFDNVTVLNRRRPNSDT